MALRPITRSLPMQLLQAREAAMTHFRPMLRTHGVTEQQWRVLRVLAAEGELDASQLATRCFLLAPSLSRILQTLERDGHITRAADVDDARRALVSLSASGRVLYGQVSPDSEALYADIEKRFGKRRLAELNTLLTDLTNSINPEDANHHADQ